MIKKKDGRRRQLLGMISNLIDTTNGQSKVRRLLGQ
jgi:hypothetical protein